LIYDVTEKAALLGQLLEYSLFDSILAVALSYEHFLSLPDAMGTFDRLVFHGWIPPPVEKKDIIRDLKVEANTTDSVIQQKGVDAPVCFESLDNSVSRLLASLSMQL